jgi:voltage-gated potassium channel Kch
LEHAAALAVAMPDEKIALETVRLAHEMAPGLTIIARCTFSSAGMKASQLGATEVVVAEQVVAREFAGALARTMKGS